MLIPFVLSFDKSLRFQAPTFVLVIPQAMASRSLPLLQALARMRVYQISPFFTYKEQVHRLSMHNCIIYGGR